MAKCHRCFKDGGNPEVFRIWTDTNGAELITDTVVCKGCRFEVQQALNFLEFEQERMYADGEKKITEDLPATVEAVAGTGRADRVDIRPSGARRKSSEGNKPLTPAKEGGAD